jgi:hypothetical protein
MIRTIIRSSAKGIQANERFSPVKELPESFLEEFVFNLHPE